MLNTRSFERSSLRLLWAGQTASLFGSAVSAFAVPTAAIVVLHASALEVALLAGTQYVPAPIFGLFAGVWADRLPRRAIMIAADVVRGVAVASVPLAAWLHAVSIAQLFAVALVVGIASVFFDVAYQSIVPLVVPAAQLDVANSRLELSNNVAWIAGSGIAGALVGLVGAATAIAVDAASYVCSVATLLRLKVPDQPARARVPVVASLRAGIAHVVGSNILAPLALVSGTLHFGWAISRSVYFVFAYDVLHVSPAALGTIVGLANIGFAGAFLMPFVLRRLGVWTTLLLSLIVLAVAHALVPLARLGPPIVMLGLAQLALSVAAPVHNLTQLTIRQRIVPDELLGRVNATMRTLVWGTLPLGFAVGGVLARAERSGSPTFCR